VSASKLTDLVFALFLLWLAAVALLMFVDALSSIRAPLLIGLAVGGVVVGYVLSVLRQLRMSNRESMDDLDRRMDEASRWDAMPWRWWRDRRK
jgi:hypothetical protein